MRACMFGCCLLAFIAGPAMAQGVIGVSPERCGELAAQIERQCAEAGGAAGECAELRARFEALCGQVQAPRPSPPPGCKERCWIKAQEQYRACLAENPDDPTGCRRQMMATLEGCMADCGEDPPPASLGCAERCRERALEAMRQCKGGDGDGAGDPIRDRQCLDVYENTLAACLAECDPTVDPPQGACRSECAERAGKAERRCRAEGGDPESCRAVAASVLRECSRRCDDGAVPPVPTGCGARCTAEAREAVAACIEAGGTPDDCWATVRDSLRTCLAGCERVPPFPCPAECRIAAAETLEACVAAIDMGAIEEGCTVDGVLDKACEAEEMAAAIAACEAAAKEQLEACVAACAEDPPGPPTCEERCELHATQYYDACIARGGDPAECEASALEMAEECMERCDWRPAPSCAASCAAEARKLFEECITPVEGEPDPDPLECKLMAMEFFESCRLECEHPAPPGCAARCRNFAAQVQRRCELAGGDPGECAQKAEEARIACAEGCPPAPPTCAERCERRMEAYARMCAAAGGDPEACAERAGALHQRCLERCERPEPRRCVPECIEQARALYSACIEDGGDCETCRAEAIALLKECAAECPTKPEPCAERCAMAARAGLAGCLDAIDEEGIVASCTDEETQEVDEACVAEAMAAAEEACRLRTNEQLAGCLAECRRAPEPPEPPTCEERCEVAAQQVREACQKMQTGDADDPDCEQVVAQFMERCQAGCAAPEPPGPSDVDCEALAARIRAGCEAEGGDPAACAERALLFQERCEARVAEHSRVMGLVREAAPRAFKRGDSNRDGKLDIADAIHTLRGLFLGQGSLACADAVDANDDGRIDIADPVRVLIHLFQGGASLPDPLGDDGHDETPDGLICE